MGNACGSKKGIAEDIMLELEVRQDVQLSEARGFQAKPVAGLIGGVWAFFRRKGGKSRVAE